MQGIRDRSTADVEVFESNKAGLRFETTTLAFDEGPHQAPWNEPAVSLTINPNKTYQEILGFGGAFTDAAALNIFALQSNLSKAIIDNYYSQDGLEYSIGRIPIGGTDFSTRKYTYDDIENDDDLGNFTLAKEDLDFKVRQRQNQQRY